LCYELPAEAGFLLEEGSPHRIATAPDWGLIMDTEHHSAGCHRAIDAKLAAILEGRTEQPGWYEAWRRLTAESTDEERLSVYQAVRDSGLVPKDAGFYLVSWQIGQMAELLAETALREIDDRLEAIRTAHGLGEDDYWSPGEVPPEYRDVSEEYERASEDLFIQVLEAHGEHDMATLYRNDNETYEQRDEAGREYFHGPFRGVVDDAEWLDLLLDNVGACVSADSPMEGLSLLHREEDGFWEVDIFPDSVELVGGANDGAIVTPLFSINLDELRSVFEMVDDFGWNAFGWHDGDGPFIWVEGLYLGRPIYLRVLAEDPRDDPPRTKVSSS
jgi:hypothetical protein